MFLSVSKIQLKAFKSLSKVDANFSHKTGISCKGNLSLDKLVNNLTKGIFELLFFKVTSVKENLLSVFKPVLLIGFVTQMPIFPF